MDLTLSCCGSPYGVMAEVLDYGLEVSISEHQSCYYVNLQTFGKVQGAPCRKTELELFCFIFVEVIKKFMVFFFFFFFWGHPV